MFDQKETFDEFETYLNGKHIPFTLAEVRLPSTDFPKQVQDQLVRFRVGDNVVVRGPQSIIILKIKSWTELPVQDADAQRIAATALQQEAVSERTAALRTQMIHDSKIEFTGDFAGMDADEPKAPPSVTTAPDSGAQPSAATPAIPSPSNTDDSQLQTSSPNPSLPASAAPATTGGSTTNPQEGVTRSTVIDWSRTQTRNPARSALESSQAESVSRTDMTATGTSSRRPRAPREQRRADSRVIISRWMDLS